MIPLKNINHLENLQNLLRKSVQQKKLLYIYQCIKQTHIVGGKSSWWGTQLIDIFLMLTDSISSYSSLQRAALVAKIFKMTIQSKMLELEFLKIPDTLKVTVSRIIKTLQFFFRQTTSGRQIKNEQLSFIHSYVGKFLSNLMGTGQNSLNKPKSSLSQKNEQKLSLIFPKPSKSESIKFQFMYPDLIQWYGFFVEIENYMRFYDTEEENIDIEISKFKQKDIVVEPILKWITNYYFLTEASIKYSQYSQSFDIKQHTLRLIISLMTEIRVSFIIYLDSDSNNKRDNDYYQNVLKVIVRFNSILVCYNLIQNIKFDDNVNLILSTISEMKKSIEIILHKCQSQLMILKKQTSEVFVFNIIEYQRQLRWIVHNLNRKEIFITNVHKKTGSKSLCQSQGAFNCLIKSSVLVSKKKLAKFIDNFVTLKQRAAPCPQFLNQISDFFQTKQKCYESQIKKLNLVTLMAQLIHRKYPLRSCLNQALSQKEEGYCLRMCVSLLTKYHFNEVELLLFSFFLSKQIISRFFNSQETINFDKNSEQINLIDLAISVLNLGQKSHKSYVCSHCQLLQPTFICKQCRRSCSCFIFPNLGLDFEKDLKQYSDLYREVADHLQKRFSGTLSKKVNLLL